MSSCHCSSLLIHTDHSYLRKGVLVCPGNQILSKMASDIESDQLEFMSSVQLKVKKAWLRCGAAPFSATKKMCETIPPAEQRLAPNQRPHQHELERLNYEPEYNHTDITHLHVSKHSSQSGAPLC